MGEFHVPILFAGRYYRLMVIEAPPPGQHPRILVCATERHIVRLIQVNLQRLGYRVSTTLGAAEATETLERSLAEEPFKIAILDDDLPDMDLQSLIDWIRSHESTQDMHVVVLGRKSNSDRGGSSPLPPAVYATRPFKPIDVIKGWLRW